jgi:hypothetical protein
MALVGSTGPIQSQEAAKAAEASGGDGAPGDRCLASVMKSPGKTAAELAAAAGLDRHVVSRRLPDLRRASRVLNGQPRACAVTGRLSLTWFPNQEVRP